MIINLESEACPHTNWGSMSVIHNSQYDMCLTTDFMTLNNTYPYAQYYYSVPEITRKKTNEIRFEILDENNENVPYPPVHVHHSHLNGHWFETHADYFQNNTYRSLKLHNNSCVISELSSPYLYGLINIDANINITKTVRVQYCFKFRECDNPLTKIDLSFVRLDSSKEDCFQRYKIPPGKSYTMVTNHYGVTGHLVYKPWIHAHRGTFKALFTFDGRVKFDHLPSCTDKHPADEIPQLVQNITSCACQNDN